MKLSQLVTTLTTDEAAAAIRRTGSLNRSILIQTLERDHGARFVEEAKRKASENPDGKQTNVRTRTSKAAGRN